MKVQWHYQHSIRLQQLSMVEHWSERRANPTNCDDYSCDVVWIRRSDTILASSQSHNRVTVNNLLLMMMSFWIAPGLVWGLLKFEFFLKRIIWYHQNNIIWSDFEFQWWKVSLTFDFLFRLALQLPHNRTTVMHLVPRETLPDYDNQQGKSFLFFFCSSFFYQN